MKLANERLNTALVFKKENITKVTNNLVVKKNAAQLQDLLNEQK
ncbi:MAG: hypothetical protein ACR5KV_04685 [Wolbachia sp.]